MRDQEIYQVIDLCEAAGQDDVEKLNVILEKQSDLLNQHVSEGDERMAIHFAVTKGCLSAVKFLMERGADPHSGIYRNATTALTMAREQNETEIEKIILQEEERRQLAACRNIVISPENEALFEAIKNNQTSQALELLDKHPELLDACHRTGGSAIYEAAWQGNYFLVQSLLNRGTNIHHLKANGQSPLDGAVLNIRPRNKLVNQGCLICVGILMQAGAKISLKSAVYLKDKNLINKIAQEQPVHFKPDIEKKCGLLQVAVENDDIETLELLLSLGLDPDDRHQLNSYETRPESWGEPLWIAAGTSRYEIAEILLQNGADPNSSLYASGGPLGRAYNNKDDQMKGLLFRYEAELDPIMAGLEGDTSAAAIALQGDVSLAQELLWAAACGGDANIVGMCLRHLDWSDEDERWFNLLEQPLRQWRLEPHRKFRDFDREVYFDIFDMILSQGASPNLTGRFGFCLAHSLAACGTVWGEPIMTEEDRLQFASILLKYDVELNIIDDLLQSTPLGWAIRWERYELAKLYLENGADPQLAGADWALPSSWAKKKKNKKLMSLISQNHKLI